MYHLAAALLLVISAWAVCSLGDASKLPNIGYIGYGYNVFSGNPHSTSEFDPGFGQAPIWALTYTQSQTTADGKWLVPDNVAVPGSATSCSVEGTSTTISSGSSYQTTLSASAKVDLSGIFKTSFTASNDYKKVSSGSSTQGNVYTSTQATCQTYLVNLNAYIHPNLSAVFVDQAVLLPEVFDASNATGFWELFDVVGTHFPNQITYGSRWGYSFESSATQWKKMQSLGIDTTVAASYAGVIKAGVTVTTSYAQQMASNFTDNTQNTYQFSLGVTPPASGSASDWLSSALTSTLMDPLEYSLTEVSQLFSASFSNDARLHLRQTAVSNALAQYCSAYLLPAGKVASCDAPPTPTPVKVIGHGALACRSDSGKVDCRKGYATIYNAASDVEAEELVLDLCPNCAVQTPFSDGTCVALAATSGAWGWAIDAGEDAAKTAAMAACAKYSTSCTIWASGCPSPAPGGNWGALACINSCATVKATQSAGYPDRLEAHRVAQSLAGTGSTVVMDFGTGSLPCGAVAKGDNGYAASAGLTPGEAVDAALKGCQTSYKNCKSMLYSCVDAVAVEADTKSALVMPFSMGGSSSLNVSTWSSSAETGTKFATLDNQQHILIH